MLAAVGLLLNISRPGRAGASRPWARVSGPRIVIGAGGTAGHVVPALAVADALRAEGAEVTFIGGERAELELVPAAGYELETLRVQPLHRRAPVRAARAALIDGAAVGRCRAGCSAGSGRPPRSAPAATSPVRSGSPPCCAGSRWC